MEQLVTTFFATAVLISFAGPASGQQWDVQLECPAGDWVLNTTVTLTCSVRRANYTGKTCAMSYSETAYFLLSPHEEKNADCRVTSFESGKSAPSIHDGCRCWVSSVDLYTCQYTFVAGDTQAGSWRCTVDCVDASGTQPLIEHTVNCANKTVTVLPECPANKYGANCATDCRCVSLSTQSCDKVNGTCYCKSGWTGADCSVDIDECTDISHRHNCTGPHVGCRNTGGGFDCVCDQGYQLVNASVCLASCTAGQFINAGDSGRCTPCPVGRYQGLNSQASCNKCPDGSTTNSTGSRNIEACQAPPEVTNTLSVRLRYVLLVICTHQDEVKTSFAVHAKVVEMQSDWSGACSDSACSNAHVTSTCEGPTSKTITSVIAIEEIPPTLRSTDNNITLPTNEAFLRAIYQSGTFDLQAFGAQLQRDDVSVTMTSSCRLGYVRSGDSCVVKDGSGISPELIGSIIGGGVGLIAVVLLVVLVVRQFRTSGPPQRPDLPPPEHPYDSLTSSAGLGPQAYWNPLPAPHSFHWPDTVASKPPGSDRASGVYSPQEAASDYDYLELQDARKDDYLTPVGRPAALTPALASLTSKPAEQEVTSKPEQEMTSKPELPSRTGVTHLSDRPGREGLGSSDTTLEVVTTAPLDSTPTAHVLAAETDYITPIFEETKA